LLPARLFLLSALLAAPALANERFGPTPDFAQAGFQAACTMRPDPAQPLDLPAIADLALCRNPATASAWAATRAAAAREVQARSLYGPRLDASVQPGGRFSWRWGGGFPAASDSQASGTAALSLGWLITDFGGREAQLSLAAEAREQALAAFADRAQAVVLEAALAYFDTLAAAESLVAAEANVAFARTSLAAAEARVAAGVGIRSDRLQADAALADAELRLARARGTAATQQGRLATALDLPPDTRLTLAAGGSGPGGRFSALAAATRDGIAGTARALIAEAERARPDLRQARAAASGAEAAVRAAEAARRPTLSLGASPSLSAGTQGPDTAVASAGVTLSVPLFDSGGRTAAVEAARRDAERARADAEASRLRAAQDVWARLQAVEVADASLATAARLLSSAEEAARLASGRYRAGLAGITELLNAQVALASAREQAVSARYGLRTAGLELARAVGLLHEEIR
jgi:outer membrane protein TolC